MRRLTLIALGLGLLAPVVLFARPDPPPLPAAPAPYTYGFLDQPSFDVDKKRRPPSTPYGPQPGDIMFSVSNALILRFGHNLAGAGEPSHSGIIFQKRDGRLGVLEAGPFDTLHIEILDMEEHLVAYDKRGRVWIRPRCVPLTPEQSCRLTEFAEMEEGKRFAMLRVWRQITPIRARGPLRTEWIGVPHGPDEKKYYCAELVVESMVYAGLIDPADARPRATYPSDFFHDWSSNPFLNKHFKLSPCWSMPARWSPCPLPACGE